jgi:hypothetical protein
MNKLWHYLRSQWMADQAVYVGSAMECLSELHGETIPELEDISQAREIEEKRLKDVMGSFSAYQLNVMQHLKYLTRKDGYLAYIQYWKEKVQQIRSQNRR